MVSGFGFLVLICHVRVTVTVTAFRINNARLIFVWEVVYVDNLSKLDVDTDIDIVADTGIIVHCMCVIFWIILLLSSNPDVCACLYNVYS